MLIIAFTMDFRTIFQENFEVASSKISIELQQRPEVEVYKFNLLDSRLPLTAPARDIVCVCVCVCV